jgi:hypothetical protein
MHITVWPAPHRSQLNSTEKEHQMNTARILSIATIVALLSATGFAQAADAAKPAVEAAAAPAAAAGEKKTVVMKKHKKHHAKKKAAKAA